MYIRFQLRQLLAVFRCAVADAVCQPALSFCNLRLCWADWQCFLVWSSHQVRPTACKAVLSGDSTHEQRSPALCLGSARSIAAGAPVGQRQKKPQRTGKQYRGAGVDAKNRSSRQLTVKACSCACTLCCAASTTALHWSQLRPTGESDIPLLLAGQQIPCCSDSRMDMRLPRRCKRYRMQKLALLTGLACRAPVSQVCLRLSAVTATGLT